jgi:hypothetical protein
MVENKGVLSRAIGDLSDMKTGGYTGVTACFYLIYPLNL